METCPVGVLLTQAVLFRAHCEQRETNKAAKSTTNCAIISLQTMCEHKDAKKGMKQVADIQHNTLLHLYFTLISNLTTYCIAENFRTVQNFMYFI